MFGDEREHFLIDWVKDATVTCTRGVVRVLFLEGVMRSFRRCIQGASLVSVGLLSACAGRDYVSDMYTPNFGLRVFSHFDASADPDPMAVANGLYAPQPLQAPCYSCSSESGFKWGSWAP